MADLHPRGAGAHFHRGRDQPAGIEARQHEQAAIDATPSGSPGLRSGWGTGLTYRMARARDIAASQEAIHEVLVLLAPY